MEVSDVICTEIHGEMQLLSADWSSSLDPGTRSVFMRGRECEMRWKRREEEGGVVFVPMMLLCFSEVTPGLPVWKLSSSPPPLPPISSHPPITAVLISTCLSNQLFLSPSPYNIPYVHIFVPYLFDLRKFSHPFLTMPLLWIFFLMIIHYSCI